MEEEILRKIEEISEILEEMKEEEAEISDNLVLSEKEALVSKAVVELIKRNVHRHRYDTVLKVVEDELKGST